MKKRSLRCLLALFLCLGLAAQVLRAADQPPATAPSSLALTNNNLSLSTTAKRAPWQQHLTLGPGDTLNFSLYLNDAADQARDNVLIGPDGRVSYLQAQDVMAAGLTIEELRTKMDVELTKFYRSPRTIITPALIQSKKYFILGSVAQRGAYPFDRPMTVIEAIARAGGLETGVFELKTVELADLSHSFMVRAGQKVPVDFEKLFQQGDLSQNIPLEPNDYLYFASASANEIYILGQVLSPGVIPFTQSSSAIGAISARGGFAPKAYRSKVLVIRGSLNNPETFVINTSQILDGKATDFRLKPKDIVFVSARPWAKVEQLLDEGTRAFVEAFIVTYTGSKIGPFINPIVN